MNRTKKITVGLIILTFLSVITLFYIMTRNNLPNGVVIIEKYCEYGQYGDGVSDCKTIPPRYVIKDSDYPNDDMLQKNLSEEMCDDIGGYYDQVYVGGAAGFNQGCLVNKPE